jgi:hypothetical protein
MPTRNVVLTNHQASFVERLVSTGRYQNASEVLREGLRMAPMATQSAPLMATQTAPPGQGSTPTALQPTARCRWAIVAISLIRREC